MTSVEGQENSGAQNGGSVDFARFANTSATPLSEGWQTAASGDVENGDSPHRCVQMKKKFGRKQCAICSSVTMVFFVIAGLVGYFVLGPIIAKSSMDNSVITFNKMIMTVVIANQSILVASEITISKVAPLGCDISAMDVTAMDKDKAFGTLRMPSMSVEAGKDNNRHVSRTILSITDDDTWNVVSNKMLMNKTIKWRLKGEASVSAMGVTFHNVPFDKEVAFMGFNGFADSMLVHSLDVLGGGPDGLNMVANVQVSNPSNIEASMGPLQLELWTLDSPPVKLGFLNMSDFSINGSAKPGAITNFPAIRAVYNPPTAPKSATDAARRFLSNFVTGKDQKVMIRGFANSTPLKHLQASMAKFSTTSIVPGLPSPRNRLLKQGVMHIPDLLRPMLLPTQLVVSNPLSAGIVFEHTRCDVYPCKTLNDDATGCSVYYEESSGYYTSVAEVINEKVPGMGKLKLRDHPVVLYSLANWAIIQTALRSAGGGSFIRLNGTATLSVNGYELGVDYTETDVPICLESLLHSCEEPSIYAITV
jgi:hypothetical protein